jgi:NAD(P)-dependent dehydrogenase (short-subunit alcohol dehydrogenase family)
VAPAQSLACHPWLAGDRGRGSNYVYGSAKAGLTAFLSGLPNRTAGRGIHVMTVKPGFVRTKMTENMKLPVTCADGGTGSNRRDYIIPRVEPEEKRHLCEFEMVLPDANYSSDPGIYIQETQALRHKGFSDAHH